MAMVPTHTYIKVKMRKKDFDSFIKDIVKGYDKRKWNINEKYLRKNWAKYYKGFAYVRFHETDVDVTEPFVEAAIKNGEYSKKNVFLIKPPIVPSYIKMIGADPKKWQYMPIYQFSFDKDKNISNVNLVMICEKNGDGGKYHWNVINMANDLIGYGDLFPKTHWDKGLEWEAKKKGWNK